MRDLYGKNENIGKRLLLLLEENLAEWNCIYDHDRD